MKKFYKNILYNSNICFILHLISNQKRNTLHHVDHMEEAIWVVEDALRLRFQPQVKLKPSSEVNSGKSNQDITLFFLPKGSMMYLSFLMYSYIYFLWLSTFCSMYSYIIVVGVVNSSFSIDCFACLFCFLFVFWLITNGFYLPICLRQDVKLSLHPLPPNYITSYQKILCCKKSYPKNEQVRAIKNKPSP